MVLEIIRNVFFYTSAWGLHEQTIEVKFALLISAELVVDALKVLAAVKLCDFFGLVRNYLHEILFDVLEIFDCDIEAITRSIFVFIISLEASIDIDLHQDIVLFSFDEIVLSCTALCRYFPRCVFAFVLLVLEIKFMRSAIELIFKQHFLYVVFHQEPLKMFIRIDA